MAKDAGTAKDIATGVTARVATIMAKKQMSAAIMAKKPGTAKRAGTARGIATADILNLGIGKRFSTS